MVRQTPSLETLGYRIFPLILFITALLPRLVALERYITPDELIWVYRSVQFREAILDGRLSETLVAGHPGVTTTWLGAIALSLQTLFSPASQESYRWIFQLPFLMPDNVTAYIRLAEFLSASRVLVVLVNSLGIVLIYLLVRRSWGVTAAIICGLFLAFDPFLIGLSGLFHVDALSATFATLSLVILGTAFDRRRDQRRYLWLAASGAAAGLAILTKTPALILLPVIGLALLVAWWRQRDAPMRIRFRGILTDGLLLGGVALITIWLLYPALWVSPMSVLSTVFGSANRHLDEALRETFFMGQVAFDHGPVFYPVVLLWRLSPVIWLALIPLAALMIDAIRNKGLKAPRGIGLVWLLLLWSVTFIIAITPAAKKFDRYILPIVPALLLLAGYVWAIWGQCRPRVARWVLPAIIAIQVGFWMVFAGYPLAAYNPLVGGPRTAKAVLPIGWGEAIGAAGQRLGRISVDATEETRAMAGIAPSLASFFPGQTLVPGIDDPKAADYVIITTAGRQLDPSGVEAQISGLELIDTIHYGGLDQAWVYHRANPRPLQLPSNLPASVVFDGRMALTAAETKVEGENIVLSTRWHRLNEPATDERFIVRLTVLDETGNIWAASESDLLNEVDFYPHDWEQDQTGTVRYSLDMTPATPPGRYKLRLSLVDLRSGALLPIRIGDFGFNGVVYEVGEFDLPLPETIVSASRVEIPVTSSDRWLGDSLWLLGHDIIPADALAGSDLPLEVFWHAPAGGLPAGTRLAWSLTPTDDGTAIPLATTPISRFDSGRWRVGETVHERYRLPIPPGLTPGRYQLMAQPVLADGTMIDPPAALAEMTVSNIDRLYEMPAVVDFSLDTCFGDRFCLRGIDLAPITTTAGQPIDLTLYWQALTEPDTVYTVFTHLVNEAEDIVLQADHWPGGIPSDIVDSGQVIIDRVPLVLPGELPPGQYSLIAGLYNAEDGTRLPVTAGSGAEDYLRLPVQVEVTNP
jgi:4-amino-4-deoxy-L-arabinose transferase-like glycosyltransferase